MKKFKLSLIGLLTVIILNGCNDKPSGISSGTYECSTQFGKINVYLYSDGKAKSEESRGFWTKFGDDEAQVIRENWILRYKGDNKYTFRGTSCIKID